jgi:hypothetical protein
MSGDLPASTVTEWQSQKPTPGSASRLPEPVFLITLLHHLLIMPTLVNKAVFSSQELIWREGGHTSE